MQALDTRLIRILLNVPLPASDQPWPPPTWNAIAADIRLADVWYSGTATDLAEHYAGAPVRERKSWWGRQRSGQQVQTEQRIHLPTAAAIAQASADLLFGETPSFKVQNAKTADRITQLVDEAGIGATLVEAAELASGLSGVYLRPVWDREVADHPMLTVMDPDRAIPEFRWGRLYAVTFWSEIEVDETKVVRHLERYEPGFILHGVYVGTSTNLGTKVDLKGYQATKNLDAVQTGGVEDLRPYDIENCAASFVPNIRPNRQRRTHPLGRHMGRADTQGLESLMSSIDEAWSSLMRDIRLGKRRIIVPDEFLEHLGRGKGATFDSDREVFSGLDIDPRAAEKAGITLVDFAIRAADHLAPITELYSQLTAACGYSTSSLGQGDDGPQKTATEVDSEETISDRTTAKKWRYFAPATAHSIEVMLKLDRGVFRSGVEVERPTVERPTAAEASMRDVASMLNLLNLAKSASIEQRVKLLHPEWDETAIGDEVDAIRKESTTQVSDPFEGTS